MITRTAEMRRPARIATLSGEKAPVPRLLAQKSLRCTCQRLFAKGKGEGSMHRVWPPFWPVTYLYSRRKIRCCQDRRYKFDRSPRSALEIVQIPRSPRSLSRNRITSCAHADQRQLVHIGHRPALLLSIAPKQTCQHQRLASIHPLARQGRRLSKLRDPLVWTWR